METGSTWTKQRKENLLRLIQGLYEIVHELEKEFEEHKRHFTPDGHLLGSLGEVIAAFAYNLELLPSSTGKHDAKSIDGRYIQIKLTGGNKEICLSSEPDYLIVLQLDKTKGIQEIYNGPGSIAWKVCKEKKRKNGQCPISLPKLKDLMQQVTNPSDKFEQINAFPALHARED